MSGSAVVDEMHRIVREVAQKDAQAGEGAKAAILRVTRALGLKYSRVRQHWYGIARSISAEEADLLRAAYMELLREKAAKLDREHEELRATLRALEEGARGMAGRHDAAVVANDRSPRLAPRRAMAPPPRPMAPLRRAAQG